MKENELWLVLSRAWEDIRPLVPSGAGFARDSVLLGPGGLLDSMAMVAYASAIEDALAEDRALEVRIVCEQAFSRAHSPFADMAALEAFVRELAEQAGADG